MRKIFRSIYARAMTGRKGPRTFRTQIVLTFTSTFLILALIAVLVFLHLQKEYLYRSSVKQTAALAMSVAASSRSWILAEDLTGIQEVINSIKDYPELDYAVIFSEDGRILGQNGAKKQVNTPDLSGVSSGHSSENIIILSDTADYLDLALPVMNNSELIAWVRIGVRRDSIYLNLIHIVIGSFAFISVSVIISYAASTLLAERMSQGISSLSIAASGIFLGRRDLRADADQSAELKNLSDSFNRMIDELVSSEKSYRSLFEEVPVSLWEEDLSEVVCEINKLKQSGIQDFKNYLTENPDKAAELASKVKVIKVNNYSVKLFKADRKEELHGSLDKVISLDSVNSFINALIALADGKRSYSGEAVNKTLKGDLLHVVITYFIPEQEKKDFSRVLVALYDVTELKQLESQLRSLNQVLEKRVNEEVAENRKKDLLLIQQSRLAGMGEMIHNIAHQWRQPLNTVSLIVQNLEDQYDAGECTQEIMNESVQRILRLLKNMSDTIEDFRNFFKPDNEKEIFSIAESVESTLSLMEAALHSAGISVIQEIPEDLKINGYSNQFSQAVLNIFANAKEAIKMQGIQKGLIRISLSKENGNAVLRICDNGGGIPEEILPKIFDPYFTTKPSGSGIGLYMTRMIVERNMHGKIYAENQNGGACITLILPVAEEEGRDTNSSAES